MKKVRRADLWPPAILRLTANLWPLAILILTARRWPLVTLPDH